MRSLFLLLPLLLLVACSAANIVPGPAPEPAGFEARAHMDGYAEYVAMAGPNLPLTPTYKVHGTATAVITTLPPYLTIYLEGDAWVEPTPAGTAAINRGEVVVFRPGNQPGWARQYPRGANTPPSGKRAYYASPSNVSAVQSAPRP